MKSLAKTIRGEARGAFAQMWLGLEDRLNEEFKAHTGRPFHGDDTNLWLQAAIRTLELTRA